jgi:hypothetical protein
MNGNAVLFYDSELADSITASARAYLADILARLEQYKQANEITVMNNENSLPQIGDRVRLTASIYDDGQDWYPPGYLAFHGDILMVREVYPTGSLEVSHADIVDSTFIINSSEYVIYNESSDQL